MKKAISFIIFVCIVFISCISFADLATIPNFVDRVPYTSPERVSDMPSTSLMTLKATILNASILFLTFIMVIISVIQLIKLKLKNRNKEKVKNIELINKNKENVEAIEQIHKKEKMVTEEIFVFILMGIFAFLIINYLSDGFIVTNIKNIASEIKNEVTLNIKNFTTNIKNVFVEKENKVQVNEKENKKENNIKTNEISNNNIKDESTIIENFYKPTEELNKEDSLKTEMLFKQENNNEEINELITLKDVKTIKDAITKKASSIDVKEVLISSDNKKVVIPAGFRVSQESAENVKDGIVIADKSGNEFVWIPIDDISLYTRTSFDNNDISEYVDNISDEEYKSVKVNGGFYIGRYESGDKETTALKKFRNSKTEEHTITIKKNQTPYTEIKMKEVVLLVKNMAKVEGYSDGTFTQISSGHAWDSAINFIKNNVNNYEKDSIQGNYENVKIEEEGIVLKENGTRELLTTGKTTPVCNIYDLGGNCWEWTSEISDEEYHPFSNEQIVIRRGGNCNTESYREPASYRGTMDDHYSHDTTFRVTLYCNLEKIS